MLRLLFSKPYTAQNQRAYVLQALREGHLQDGGPFATQAETALQRLTGAKAALLTSSCSGALDLAFWDMPPGGEVIVPAYNFPAAGNAVLRAGGRVVLCDIDPATQNISPAAAAALVGPNTYAICVMHYASVACDMSAFLALAKQHNLLLVEDAAHAVGASWNGLALGAVGDAGALSFHLSKNVQCGQGGALLLPQRDARYRAALIRRDKGTNRQAFLAGEKDYYSWEDTGSGLGLAGLSAALLAAQLEEVSLINTKRLAVCSAYHKRLAPAFSAGKLHAMQLPAYAAANGHIYYVRTRDEAQQIFLRSRMEKQGIPLQTHYVPLHLGAMGQRLGYRKGDFPFAEQTARTLLRLPVWPDLTDADIDFVCRHLLEALDEE